MDPPVRSLLSNILEPSRMLTHVRTTRIMDIDQKQWGTDEKAGKERVGKDKLHWDTNYIVSINCLYILGVVLGFRLSNLNNLNNYPRNQWRHSIDYRLYIEFCYSCALGPTSLICGTAATKLGSSYLVPFGRKFGTEAVLHCSVAHVTDAAVLGWMIVYKT